MRGSSTGLGRWSLMSVGVTVVAALCVAAILLVGSPSEEASKTSAPENGRQSTRSHHARALEPTMVDGRRVSSGHEARIEEDARWALVEDARWYARDAGVPLKEAIRRLQMQDDPLPTDLERKLKKEEPHSYAGLWLRHKPDYGITVALTGDSEAAAEKVRRFVEGTQWEGTVNIKHVEASLVELNAARAEAEGTFDRLGIGYASGSNIFKNRMEIYVTNRDRVLRKLGTAGLEMPEHVVVIEQEPMVPE